MAHRGLSSSDLEVARLRAVVRRQDTLLHGVHARQTGAHNPDSILAELRKLRAIVEDFEASGGGSATLVHPFQLIDAESGLLRVRYGTVNDVVPTLGGTALSANPTTDLSGTDGTYLVYLTVTYSTAGTVSGVVVNANEGGTLPSYDDTHDYITLGEADVASGLISELRQAVTHSLRHGICGRVLDGETVTTSGTPYFWGV